MSKEIKKITADEVYPVSMRRLGDRPNSSSAQGRGGMSSAELKGFMDKYPELVKERLNELIDMCNADSKDGIAKAIKTPVINPETGNEISLYDWFAYASTYLKGDGIEQINAATTGTVQKVVYNTTFGATVKNDAAIKYTDRTDGTIKTQNFPLISKLPILPGKYISIVANAGANAIYIKVDDTALALDYYKIDKGEYPAAIVPIYYQGKQGYKLIGYQSGIGTLVMRGGNGEIKCDAIDANYWRDLNGNQILKFTDVKSQLIDGCLVVSKTPTDTGSLSTSQLTMLKKLPQYQIQYNNQTYYRMDPLSAPDGTLNYIHIDSVQDGQNGYKATGKCFSITVSTKAWKVFDLEFGGSGTGNGIDQIGTFIQSEDYQSGDVSVSTEGIKYQGFTEVQYTDSTTGEIKTQIVPTTNVIPLKGSDYINIDAAEGESRAAVSLDDLKMSQDFIKIDKTRNEVVPQYLNGAIKWTSVSSYNAPNWIAQRDGNGDCEFNKVLLKGIALDRQNSYPSSVQQIFYSCAQPILAVDKTSTDTGTLTTNQIILLDYPNVRIKYNNQIYILQDPTTAPGGTLNYVHLDAVQDGSYGYKATGKCFSITVSTRAWKVVNLNFTKSYTHQICISNPAANTKYYLTIINNKSASYHGNAAGLITDLSDTDTEFQPATRLHTTNGVAAALLYRSTQNYLVAQYGTSTEQMTANQIVVWDDVM